MPPAVPDRRLVHTYRKPCSQSGPVPGNLGSNLCAPQSRTSPTLPPMAEKHLWNRRAGTRWWSNALQHAEPRLRNGVYFDVHPLTQLAWSDPAVLPPPESLRELSQVRGRYATHPPPQPSLLAFPGPGVINSATRTMAMRSIDWQQVRATAAALECGDESPDNVVDAIELRCGTWQVVPSNLEYVIAMALVDQLVRTRPAGSESTPTHPTIEFEPSKMYAAWRRAGLACPEAPNRTPSDGWRRPCNGDDAESPALFLDSAAVMSSRDMEPVIWPKAWHFTKKLAARDGDDEEQLACFGTVPVQWVPEARCWMSGNRHRVAAALLHGVAFAARPKSGSPSLTLP